MGAAEPYIDTLVADSVAFLRNVPLHEMAHEVVTCPAVVSEIRDRATRDRLQVLPYRLRLTEPSDEAVRQVSEFARHTGDLRFLSATDVRVLALTLQLARERGAEVQLTPPPALDRVQVQMYKPQQAKQTGSAVPLPAGFVAAKLAQLSVNDSETTSSAGGDSPAESKSDQSNDNATLTPVTNFGDGVRSSKDVPHENDNNSSPSGDVDDPSSEEVMYDAVEVHDDNDATSGSEEEGPPSDEGKEGSEEEEEEQEGEDDDDAGWITPGNVAAAKAEMSSQAGESREPIKVGCMTSDYTMQNVLSAMRLAIVSVEGRRIRQTRRFVLRCFGCYQITPDTQKQFCPWCGHRTLKRVSVTLRPDGTQQVHISTRKPISKRGTKFSLPLPRGGKYSAAPVLCADQPLPQQRATARSQASNALLSDDFAPGASPFSARDVTSRAAQLGRSGQRRHVPNWERRNPNARAPPTGNKKKRRK